jgi:hypothetical protein
MISAQTPTTITDTSPDRWSRPRRLYRALARRRVGIVGVIEHLILAGLAYIPLVLVKQGIETSDTKTYLYLNPGRFVRQVATMWDPTVGLGTVTHQYIGYLLPMGPFYWFFSAIGVPVWVAQRLWLGSMLFAAGAGVLYLSRTLSVRAPGRTVAALAFMLSPYFLQYAGRISVILLPWAGLPFMVALTARAVRHGGWRYPAMFAIVVALTSGINATAIVYVGVAPVLWLIFAVAVQRETTVRAACVVALKMALLTVLCSLWWIAGLVVEAGYGVDVLRYTETLSATTRASSAADVIRGLGYWYFYGKDRLGSWTQSANLYTGRLWLVAGSYAIPVLSFISAAFVRWRYRAFFAVVILVGVALSVGAHPLANPTPFGRVLKAFMLDTTAGLALRSTDRATPLVILGLAMLLGAGIAGLRTRLPKVSLVFALVVAAVVVADNPAIFNGDAEVSSFFTQPAKLPGYQMAAIKHLNATHRGTRVLAIPGETFAAYTWGDTVDPPQPAFLNRSFVTREQQVMGSIATADTLAAMDDPIQLGIEQWASLAPMARLLSAGDVLVEYDQDFEHYNSPEPGLLAQQLAASPAGLSDPVSFGKPKANVSSYPNIAGQDLAQIGPLPVPSPLVDYTVADPRPITRGESDTGALVVAGDANGLEALSAAGLLNTNSAIYYSGTLDKSPKELKKLVESGAALIVTDTNRKQAFRWDTFIGDYGYTETPSEDPAKTQPSDSPIELSPGAPISSKTTAGYLGAIEVTASSYGNSASYTPEDAAYGATDDNPETSWNTGSGVSDPAGQWWQITAASAVTSDNVTLVQPQTGDLSRWVTRATLTFDGKHPVTVNLGPASRAATGQVISFPTRTFHTLRVTIDRTNNDHIAAAAATQVGFAEVEIPGLRVLQVIKLPTDLLKAVGAASIDNRLTIDMTRERVSAYLPPYRTDPETTISREFTLPTARTFSLSGTASLSALIPDDEIDKLVGRESSGPSKVVAYSNGRLPGGLQSTASAAADGNLATAWQPGFGAAYQKGDWLEYDLPKSITFDNLDLQVVADGRHSIPTAITISTENGSRAVTLPPIVAGKAPGTTVSVPVSFPAISGRQVRITITGVRLVGSTNYYSPTPVALPLGIAEVGIPGVQVNPVPTNIPGSCQSNLISIDGQPISVAVVGSASTALQDGEVSIVPCGPDVGGITLGPGDHVVETALGHSTTTGWDVDQLILDSAPGGGAAAAAPFGALAATQPGPAPTVTVSKQSATTQQVKVSGPAQPFELVLGESVNPGWKAVATPSAAALRAHPKLKSVELGSSQLVDGFANGWQVTAADLRALGSGSFMVSLDWAPQREVWAALLISALALAFCLALALLPLRRLFRRSRHSVSASANEGGSIEATAVATEVRHPVLASPLWDRGRRPHVWAIALAAVMIGAAAAGVSSLRLGGAVALAAAAALTVRWFRGLLTLSAVGFLAAAGVSIVVGKHTHTTAHYASSFVWIALVALAADAIVGTAREWRGDDLRVDEHGPQSNGNEPGAAIGAEGVSGGDVAHGDALSEEAPLQNAATENAATEGDPPEDTPTEDTPTEDTPTEDTPTEDAPPEDAPPEDAPPEDAPPEHTPAEEIPIQDPPAELD